MKSDEESKESQGSSRDIASQESCEWDNFQDTSSYFYDSFDNSTTVTYRLNSSTDNLLLDHWPEENVDSEEIENIQRYQNITENLQREVILEEMAPKTPDQLNEDFTLFLREWNKKHNRTKKYKNLSRIAVDECEEIYQQLNSTFVKLPSVDPEWETNFPELSTRGQ